LIKHIKNSTEDGIEVGGRRIQTLFYADDIVLIAEYRYALQHLMDLVTQYAEQWRFDLNQAKSAVVVFGRKRAPRNITWKLGGGEVRQLTRYKYLGVELTRTLDWSPHVKKSLARAKKNVAQIMAMGVSGGFLSPKLADHLWKSLAAQWSTSAAKYGGMSKVLT